MSDKIYDWRELSLERGDTLLCAGRSPMSNAIRKFQNYTGANGKAADITHVAEVEEWANGETTAYESTSRNKWAGKSGVQENDFRLWLDNYNGAVYVRKWDFERDDEYCHKSDTFIFRHKDDPYESGIPGGLELLLCGLRLHRYIGWAFPDYTPTFTSEPHCTELIAMKKIYHGQLRHVFANRLPPWMWWDRIDKSTEIPISKPLCIKE